MKIKDLIIIDDNNKFILNWEIIESIKEFDKLKTTYQNPLWHSEGDVWTHTLYVATNALYSGEDRDFNNKDFVLFVMGALFHDIGKGACTVFNHERNTWSSREHAEIGSQMIKGILNEEDDNNVKVIEFYVKNHMLPLEINESNFIDTIEALKNEIIDSIPPLGMSTHKSISFIGLPNKESLTAPPTRKTWFSNLVPLIAFFISFRVSPNILFW